MSILMPLSQLAGVSISALTCSYHFFRSYTSSLQKPYCSKSFLTHSSHDFFGQHFFLFQVISTYITSHIWELMSQHMTLPYHCKRLWIIRSSIFTATPILSQRSSVNTLSTSITPHIILIIWNSNPCNLPHSQQ